MTQFMSHNLYMHCYFVLTIEMKTFLITNSEIWTSLLDMCILYQYSLTLSYLWVKKNWKKRTMVHSIFPFPSMLWFYFFFFSFIFISWRLITLQYCSGFCHTLKCYDFHCMFLFSHLVMSDSFWPHGLQHSRLHCPLLYLKVCSNSCSFCQWCHWTVSSSVVPFSSCLQSFQALESFPMI